MSRDNDAFPFSTAQAASIAGVDVLCLRLTFVGEMGYELHIPYEEARKVYDLLRAAGDAYVMTTIGLYMLPSLLRGMRTFVCEGRRGERKKERKKEPNMTYAFVLCVFHMLTPVHPYTPIHLLPPSFLRTSI